MVECRLGEGFLLWSSTYCDVCDRLNPEHSGELIFIEREDG